MNQIRAYIDYINSSKTRHDIHSPFVFSFIEKCLHAKMDKKSKCKLRLYLKSLRKNKSILTIQDFGVGSKSMGEQRKVRDIVRVSGSRGKYGKLLFNLTRYFHVNSVLELGTSVGIGTFSMQLGSPDAIITTIEGCNQTQNIAIQAWESFDLKIANPICSQFIHHINQDFKVYDLIYIDGHHDGKALLNYVQCLQKNATNETIFVVDDIHWSNSMHSAWQELIKLEIFHLSIEFFRMGLLIQRKEQSKQHFILRY